MINIIGLGPGEFDYITKLGEKLIYASDILIGGKVFQTGKDEADRIGSYIRHFGGGPYGRDPCDAVGLADLPYIH